MHVISWMCHASWLQASLTNSAWSSSWPVGQTQPLCEVSTWPITFLLLERANMLLQQRQPPPPASSGEMNGSSEGAQGRASKSLGAAGPPTWLLQMLPLGHPKHDHVHNYSWASPTRSLICFCLHKKLFPQLQMECESAIKWKKENIRLLL